MNLQTISEIIENHALSHRENFDEDLAHFDQSVDKKDDNFIFITSAVYMFVSTYEKTKLPQEEERAFILDYIFSKKYQKDSYKNYIYALFLSLIEDDEVIEYYQFKGEELKFFHTIAHQLKQ